jgi:hypothetical protein
MMLSSCLSVSRVAVSFLYFLIATKFPYESSPNITLSYDNNTQHDSLNPIYALFYTNQGMRVYALLQRPLIIIFF